MHKAYIFFQLQKVFFIRILFCFLITVTFFTPKSVFGASWVDSLPVTPRVDVSGGSDNDTFADIYQLDDFMSIKSFVDVPWYQDFRINPWNAGDWNNFNANSRTAEEGFMSADEKPYQYYLEMHGDDGATVRLLYHKGGTISSADDKLTGFTVLTRDGDYREFYAQDMTEGLTEKELEDKWGNAELAGLVNRFYRGTAEHDQMLANIQNAVGIKFTVDGQERGLTQKADFVEKIANFKSDWDSGLSSIATQNGFPSDNDPNVKNDRDLLYEALLRNAAGLSLTPEQQQLIDRLAAAPGVTKLADGRVMTTARANGINNANSETNQAAANNWKGSANAGSAPDNNGQCYGQWFIDVDNCFEQLMYIILGVFSWMLGFSAMLFGWVFNFTVVGMSEFFSKLTAINTVWRVFRDFTNILFIFILLYLAISTILGMNEHGVKHTLSKLILVAVLINFSMFFSKAIIDASNILAISFYQKVNPSGREAQVDTANLGASALTVDRNGGIAGIFMNSFNLQKMYEGDAESKQAAFAKMPNTGTMFIMGSITMFLVTCMFLAATIIFINRLKTLMVLVMTSSLAFAGLLLHKTEGMAHQWWEKLLKEAFYAPIFMAIIWMALLVMSDPDFSKVAPSQQDSAFSVASIVNYIIVINFFLMALVVGEKLGVAGASGAMKSYKWLKANVGGRAIQAGLVRPVGKMAYRYYEGKDKEGNKHGRHGAFKQWMEASLGGANGKFAEVRASIYKAALGGMVNAKVGAGASQKEDFQQKQHAMQEFMAEVKDNPKAQAEFLMKMNSQTTKDLNIKIAFQKLVEDMKPEETAEMIVQLEDIVNKGANATGTPEQIKEAKEAALQAQETANHIMGRMTAAQSDSIDRKKEGVLPFHKQRFDELAKAGDTVGLRQFVQGLNATQQAGLNSKQRTDDRIIDLLGSKALVQMEGTTHDEQQEKIAQVIDNRIKRMQIRGKAQADSSKESRRAILREVMQYKQSIGHEDFKKADGTKKSDAEIAEMYADVDDDTKLSEMHEKAKSAMTYYDQKMIKGDGAIAQNGRNLARTYGASKLGSDGEKIRQKFDEQIKAGQVEVGKIGTPKDRKEQADALRTERAAAAQARAAKATQDAAAAEKTIKDAAEATERAARERFARDEFGG